MGKRSSKLAKEVWLSLFAFHPEAKKELENAVAWYETRQLGLGDRFQSAVEVAISRIEQTPLAHARIQGGFRRILVARYPYGIIYRAVGETVYVLACFHGHRNPRHWRERL